MKLLQALVLAAVQMLLPHTSPAQAPNPQQLQEMLIGRRYFFDFGPPNDYFDVYIVKREHSGVSIKRISLTPEANKCTAPARTEFVQKSIPTSFDELLDGRDPCQISERTLKKEAMRQKKYLALSGAVATIEVSCGGRMRLLKTGVGDKDWFSSNPNTPKNTSWSSDLIARLDKATESNVMESSMFAVYEPTPEALQLKDEELIQNLSSGIYDELFPDTELKVSQIYQASLYTPPKPTVELVSSAPVSPISYKLPSYPRLAWIVNQGGTVRITFVVDENGNVEIPLIGAYRGTPLFRGAVEDAVRAWKFPPGSDSREMTATFDFKLNCNPKDVFAPAANSEDKGSVKR